MYYFGEQFSSAEMCQWTHKYTQYTTPAGINPSNYDPLLDKHTHSSTTTVLTIWPQVIQISSLKPQHKVAHVQFYTITCYYWSGM